MRLFVTHGDDAAFRPGTYGRIDVAVPLLSAGFYDVIGLVFFRHDHLLDVNHLPTVGRYQPHPEHELPADLHPLPLDRHLLTEEADKCCLRVRRVVQAGVGAIDLLDARHHAIERRAVGVWTLAVDP